MGRNLVLGLRSERRYTTNCEGGSPRFCQTSLGVWIGSPQESVRENCVGSQTVTSPGPLRSVPEGPDSSAPAASVATLAQLLSRSALGDEAAFADLYDATAARVFGLVLRVLRSHAMAEEVTQEVYLQVWQTAARFDPARGSAMSWLMTLAHRRAVDRIRSTEADTRRDTAHHQDSREVEHDVTAAAAEASIEAERVRTALESLSPIQRTVLELAYFGGHTPVRQAEVRHHF